MKTECSSINYLFTLHCDNNNSKCWKDFLVLPFLAYHYIYSVTEKAFYLCKMQGRGRV